MGTNRNRKVFAKRHLSEGSSYYKPGDEITTGELFENCMRYAALGQIEVEEGAFIVDEPTDIAKSYKEAIAQFRDVKDAVIPLKRRSGKQKRGK